MRRDWNPSGTQQEEEQENALRQHERQRERNGRLFSNQNQVVGKISNQDNNVFQSMQSFQQNKSQLDEGGNLEQGSQGHSADWENRVTDNSFRQQGQDAAYQGAVDDSNLSAQLIGRLEHQAQQRESSYERSQGAAGNRTGSKFGQSNRPPVSISTSYSDIFKKLQSRLHGRRVHVKEHVGKFLIIGKRKCREIHEQNMKLGVSIEDKVRERSKIRKSIDKINQVFSSAQLASFQEPQDRSRSLYDQGSQ